MATPPTRDTLSCYSRQGLFRVHHEERLEKVDLWEEILQTSRLVRELPPSLGHSGREELEEMMFFSLCRAMIKSRSRNAKRLRNMDT